MLQSTFGYDLFRLIAEVRSRTLLTEGEWIQIKQFLMSSNHPSLNPVERLLEIVIVTVTLSVTAYLIGWALWLW